MAQLKFVIIGHVDHGKSTLIGRLLFDTDSLPAEKIEEAKRISSELGRETEFAYLLDHLEEERRQGITIDTTQVFFKHAGREYVIIDAPGHVEFVRNMITGAAQAEAAVLIIDAKEGIQEQTKRHAFLLSLMGLKQTVVLINKMDTVDFDEKKFDAIKHEMGSFFDSIGVSPLFYIPVSALKGDNIVSLSPNMPWYTGSPFVESLSLLNSRDSKKNEPLMFPVQDIYKIGDKRIVAGKVLAGSVRTGDRINILPGNRLTRVATVEGFMRETDSACAGESTGITTSDPVFVDRGDVITYPGNDAPVTTSFRASVFWLSKEPFDINERITFRCATQSQPCRIERIINKLDSSSLSPIQNTDDRLNHLEVCEVMVRTKKPVVISTGGGLSDLGRFVLARNENISAGGIITALDDQLPKGAL